MLLHLALAALAAAADTDLVGTWLSKLNTVFTGPGFYDPVDELLIEPALPGILYLFTEDGHYEEALYRVVPNPTDHDCPSAVLIYTHGTYEVLANGLIALSAITVDSRQLLLEPCSDNGKLAYTRYDQATGFFLEYLVYVDPYHGRYRIDLYEWDGTPVQPLYLAYRPPLMLPTITLNPTDSALAATSVSNRIRRIKRGLENRSRTTATKRTLDHTVLVGVSFVFMAMGGACLAYARL